MFSEPCPSSVLVLVILERLHKTTLRARDCPLLPKRAGVPMMLDVLWATSWPSTSHDLQTRIVQDPWMKTCCDLQTMMRPFGPVSSPEWNWMTTFVMQIDPFTMILASSCPLGELVSGLDELCQSLACLGWLSLVILLKKRTVLACSWPVACRTRLLVVPMIRLTPAKMIMPVDPGSGQVGEVHRSSLGLLEPTRLQDLGIPKPANFKDPPDARCNPRASPINEPDKPGQSASRRDRFKPTCEFLSPLFPLCRN